MRAPLHVPLSDMAPPADDGRHGEMPAAEGSGTGRQLRPPDVAEGRGAGQQLPPNRLFAHTETRRQRGPGDWTSPTE